MLGNRAFPPILIAFLSVAAGTVPVAAMTLQYLTPAERVRLSERIVRGNVTSLEGVSSPEGGIETRVTVRVSESFKGPSTADVTFTVPGGTDGSVTTLVPGAPAYERGQDVIVMLQPVSDGTLMPIGLPQGSFHVRKQHDGTAVVVPDISTADLDDAPGVGEDVLAAQPLERFLATLRLLVKQGPASPEGGRSGLGSASPRDVAPPPPRPQAQFPAPDSTGPAGGPARALRWPLVLGLGLLVVLALVLWRRRR
ncbi:MAG: hypothetical protein HY814_06240 [Candidatus Riflebacteria bacterium]|nr:hypothetical protein [Candidatus Riflebacteria bacterium]